MSTTTPFSIFLSRFFRTSFGGNGVPSQFVLRYVDIPTAQDPVESLQTSNSNQPLTSNHGSFPQMVSSADTSDDEENESFPFFRFAAKPRGDMNSLKPKWKGLFSGFQNIFPPTPQIGAKPQLATPQLGVSGYSSLYSSLPGGYQENAPTPSSPPKLIFSPGFKRRRSMDKSFLVDVQPTLAAPSHKRSKGHLGYTQASCRDWNREFHEIMATPITARGPALRKLSEEFVSEASTLGKIIIEERSLPAFERTLQPLYGKGVAGGDKFLHNNIFFKYAIDSSNLFKGDDECAMKVAGHELKGHTAFVACGMVTGLNFGLMCIIDYRGFRLLCTSRLPISEDTLVYGSMDGGHTVLNSCQDLSDKVQRCANILNLKGHVAGLSTNVEFLHGPCDVEGHLGKDGKYYMVDLARIWPPRLPSKSKPGGFLYRMLRPEFVARYPKPLSSDAFSLFGNHNRDEHDEEVRVATHHLEEVVVPLFVEALNQLPNNSLAYRGVEGLEWIVRELHRAGINTFYLGTIQEGVADTVLRGKLLTEMTARVLKSELRKNLRKLSSGQDSEYKQLVVDFFNLVLGCSQVSQSYWDTQLPSLLENKYEIRVSKPAFVRALIDTELLCLRLQSMIGVTFSHKVDLSLVSPFFMASLEEIRVQAKHMYMVNRIEADSAASLARTTGGEEAYQLLLLAKERYNDALSSKSDDTNVLMNLGLVFHELSKLAKDDAECQEYLQLSYHNFELSIEFDPSNVKAFLMWGNVLHDQLVELCSRKEPKVIGGDMSDIFAVFELAQSKFQAAADLSPLNYSLLLDWANLRFTLGKFLKTAQDTEALRLFESAENLYQDALSAKRGLEALVNWGCVLLQIFKLKKQALISKCSTYLKQAQALFLEAEELESGVASYNLACVHSLMGDFESCTQWLMRSRGQSTVPEDALYSDEDLEPFRVHLQSTNKLTSTFATVPRGSERDWYDLIQRLDRSVSLQA